MRFKDLSKVTWLEGQSVSGPTSKLIPLCQPAQLPVEALASHIHAQSLRLLSCKMGVTGSAVAKLVVQVHRGVYHPPWPWAGPAGTYLQELAGRGFGPFSERLPFHFSFSCIGEGNGNPLQCSCLENPRDGGAWWASIYGVAQSRTRLK